MSRVAGPSGDSMQTLLVGSTQVVATPTVVVDAPSCEETKQAFDEVSSVLQSVSTQQMTSQVAMSSLALEMEQMKKERADEAASMAQVKATLERTLSASSSLEMQMGQAEAQ